ncbi:lamin-like protein [Macadamia integrifolia]|uniref:lamin-like protein n=1 Tax=Macadamia integrifolia TaxID=60698 RepID=UPI001C4EC5EB|nr:lamin-like protein [Macadamia integrifolia]
MAVVGRGIASPGVVLTLTVAVLLVMISRVSSTRYIVGSNMGWTSNVNYTNWAKGKHFYLGDWLFFVYDRNQMNVLEVNKTNYDQCIETHPIHNWTTGAGRDVVPLNVTKRYYFISGKGFCFGGMKISVLVENLPPPPTASLNEKSGSPPTFCSYRGHIVLPAAFAIAAVWNSFLRFW